MDKAKYGAVVKKLLEEDNQNLLDSYSIEDLYKKFSGDDIPRLTSVLFEVYEDKNILRDMTIIVDYMYKGLDIKEIVIPEYITCIGYGAFKDCSLERIYYKGTEQEWKRLLANSNFPCIDKKVEICYYKNKKSTYWNYDENGKIVTWQED